MTTTLTRRAFAKLSTSGIGLFVAFGSLLSMTGCTLMDKISSYVGIGLSAFNSVIVILSTAGVIPPGLGVPIQLLITAVKAAFADVSAAIAAYENAPAGDKSTLLGKVTTALAAVELKLQQFWNDLSIPDVKLASLIESLLGLITSTISAFITQLPPAPKPAPPIPQPAQLSRRLSAPPQKRTVSQFRKEFDAIVTAGGYPQNVI